MTDVRILTVEDADDKYDVIEAVLKSNLGGLNLALTRASEFAEAMQMLSKSELSSATDQVAPHSDRRLLPARRKAANLPNCKN
jgi:hypothetical protein